MMPRCWASIVSFCVFLCVSLYLRPAGACEMDFIDAKSRNDNLTTSTYVALPMMASPLTICPPGDKDFFRWKLEKNTTLTFAITCDTPELQLEGFLVKYTPQYHGYAFMNVLQGKTFRCNYTETLPPQEEPIWWFFEIQSGDVNRTGTYSLLIREGPLCDRSNLDTNVNKSSAEVISLPYKGSRNVCPEMQEQWFKVVMNESRNITVGVDGCAPGMFPPKQLIGVWDDGVQETVVINTTKSQCIYGIIGLTPRNESNPYLLRFYSPTGSVGPFTLSAQLQPIWSIPPPSSQFESHRYLAITVLLFVLSGVLIGGFVIWWMRQRDEEGEDGGGLLLESFVAQRLADDEENEEASLVQKGQQDDKSDDVQQEGEKNDKAAAAAAASDAKETEPTPGDSDENKTAHVL